MLITVSVLTYLKPAQYAVSGQWHPGYFKLESYISLVPSWQKAGKDFLGLILLILSLYFPAADLQYQAYKQYKLEKVYIFLLMFLGIAFARSIISQYTLIQILILLRPIILIISLFVFCSKHLNLEFLLKIFNLINFLGVFQVYYCFFQRYNAVVHNGISWFSRGDIRAVGTFINPNTMGFFVVLLIYLNFYINPTKLKIFISFFYILPLFWADSLTGLLLFCLFMVERVFTAIVKKTRFWSRNSDLTKILVLPLFGLVVILLASLIKNSSNRGSGYSISGGRLEIFFSYLNTTNTLSIILGKYWGFGSNVLQTVSSDTLFNQQNNHTYFLADSTFTALIAQFGLVGLALVFSVFYCLWWYPKLSGIKPNNNYFSCRPNMIILLYLFLTGFATNIFENYAILPIIISLLFLQNKINVYVCLLNKEKKYAQ
ncbi:hypothetical protein [[Phormidium] sp. ETS-05]|uniref:hypothetical protein n=1 Tax=[Phormidium] sp. ETS-05 TaxID=222819 RepID=UPI0018EEF464|nr:hypothetical protein [[Phormidium] sp. ETS-05]